MDDDDDEYGDFDEDGDVADDETFYADHTSGGPGGETWGDDDTMPWAPDLDDEGGVVVLQVHLEVVIHARSHNVVKVVCCVEIDAH